MSVGIRHCNSAFNAARPQFAKTTYLSRSGVQYLATRLVLPLSDDGMKLSVVLIGVVITLDSGPLKQFGDVAFRPERDDVELL